MYKRTSKTAGPCFGMSLLVEATDSHNRTFRFRKYGREELSKSLLGLPGEVFATVNRPSQVSEYWTVSCPSMPRNHGTWSSIVAVEVYVWALACEYLKQVVYFPSETIARETTVCPNCEEDTRTSDGYCSNCGKVSF